MTSIDVFYQGEGIREIAHFEAAPDHSFAAVKLAIIEKHGLSKEILIYLEDRDEPVDEAACSATMPAMPVSRPMCTVAARLRWP